MHGLTGLLHGNMIARVVWSEESLIVVWSAGDGGDGEAIAARLFNLVWLLVV